MAGGKAVDGVPDPEPELFFDDLKRKDMVFCYLTADLASVPLRVRCAGDAEITFACLAPALRRRETACGRFGDGSSKVAHIHQGDSGFPARVSSSCLADAHAALKSRDGASGGGSGGGGAGSAGGGWTEWRKSGRQRCGASRYGHSRAVRRCSVQQG